MPDPAPKPDDDSMEPAERVDTCHRIGHLFNVIIAYGSDAELRELERITRATAAAALASKQ